MHVPVQAVELILVLGQRIDERGRLEFRGEREVCLVVRDLVKFGDTHYQPIQQNGQAKYEVVEVK